MVAALGSGENTERHVFFYFGGFLGRKKREKDDFVLGVVFFVSENCLASC
jgi:hypothetical protein